MDKADEQKAVGDPYLSLEIRDVGTDLVVHSWDIHAKVKIGFMQLLDNHWKGRRLLVAFFLFSFFLSEL